MRPKASETKKIKSSIPYDKCPSISSPTRFSLAVPLADKTCLEFLDKLWRQEGAVPSVSFLLIKLYFSNAVLLALDMSLGIELISASLGLFHGQEIVETQDRPTVRWLSPGGTGSNGRGFSSGGIFQLETSCSI